MRYTFLMCVLLMLAIHANSQYTISGTIFDNQGKALPGASVYLIDSQNGTVAIGEGEFFIEDVKAGEHNLQVSFIGFESYSKLINVNENLVLNIVLNNKHQLIDEVVVKAIRAGSKDPVARDLIEKKDIDQKNFGQDIPTLLNMSPSVISSSDAGTGIGYSGFRVRGTDANRINITIDGVPLNDAESHSVYWVNMPDFVSSVEDVQIQRGVGTSTNGAAAFGASVNFRTITLEKEPYARIDAGYGSFNTYKNSMMVNTGTIRDHFNFSFRYSGIHSDGYIDRSRTDLSSYYLSAIYRNDHTLIHFKNFRGNEEVYQAWGGVPSSMLLNNRTYNPTGYYQNEEGEDAYYDNQIDHYEQQHYHLMISHQFSPFLSFNSTLHYTKGAGYYEEYKDKQKFSDYGMANVSVGDSLVKKTDLIRQRWLDNDFYGLVFSLNYQNEKLDASFGGSVNNYKGNHYGEIIWARFSGLTEKDYQWYKNQGTKPEYNFYTKLNYSLDKKINVYGDLQLRHINYSIEGIDNDLRDIAQDHDFLFFNPKLGVNYCSNDNNRLFFSFAIANREPNRDNFVDADPAQPVPQFETLYDYELGYDIHSDNLNLGANLYYMDYDNQLVLTGEINDVGSAVMTNVKDSYRAGVELYAKVKLMSKLEWQANLSLSRNKIKNLTNYVDNWDYWNDPDNQPYQYVDEIDNPDIAFSPSVTASNLISYSPLKGLVLSLQSKYVGEQFIDNTSSADHKLDSWFTNDLIFNYEIKGQSFEKMRFSFMIINLFDHEYESNAWLYKYYSGGKETFMDGYFPQAGIHFMTGVSLVF